MIKKLRLCQKPILSPSVSIFLRVSSFSSNFLLMSCQNPVTPPRSQNLPGKEWILTQSELRDHQRISRDDPIRKLLGIALEVRVLARVVRVNLLKFLTKSDESILSWLYSSIDSDEMPDQIWEVQKNPVLEFIIKPGFESN
jgi:hypothetical protein